MKRKMKTEFKIGDEVDYHAIIGGPVTSIGHTIKNIGETGERSVAWISDKRGFVSMSALSLSSYRDCAEEDTVEPK